MKEITLLLEDESLCELIDEEAESMGWTQEEVVLRALFFWKSEKELDEEEMRELEEARREWQENGGMDAKEFSTVSVKRRKLPGHEVPTAILLPGSS